jgi:hypothetical protein
MKRVLLRGRRPDLMMLGCTMALPLCSDIGVVWCDGRLAIFDFIVLSVMAKITFVGPTSCRFGKN